MRYLIWSMLLAMLLTTVAIISRPLLPIDETRYLTVAWEAHVTGDYLVSHLNGQTYAHKPPLLFWLINAVWAVTGVKEIPARLVAPLAGVFCLPLTWLLARRLWPDSESVRRCTPLILVTFMLWMIFSPMTMFDTLLTCSTLTALLGVLRVSSGAAISGWMIVGFSMGVGILAKGPVILVHVVPAMLFAPWWSSTAKSKPLFWYTGLFCSILLAAAVGLSWALPAAASGGEAYASELLYGQTAGRMVKSFAHKHPVWWYLPWLPLCLMPWIAIGPVWRGISAVKSLDNGMRFVLTWIAGSLMILSLVSGKQIHYLLPIVPAFALALARLATSTIGPFRRVDLAFIVPGTVALGLVSLALNHIQFFADAGLSGIVADVYAIPLIACGLVLPLRQRWDIESLVLAVATSSTVVVSLVVGSVSQTLWQGFDLKPLAEFAAECDRPLAWLGNHHGQLNFIGAIPFIKEVGTEDELRQWLIENPDGAVIIPISPVAGVLSEEALSTLRNVDRSEPDSEQQTLLSKQINAASDFPLSDQNPEVIFVQWVRREKMAWPHIVAIYPAADGSKQ